MENVSAFTTAAKHRIPTTLSVHSLDLGQLVAASVVQNSSLLSESVTYVSDLSDSSLSETLPAFPMHALSGLATVSLGEHLKMFPGTTCTTTDSRIMLASPTAPRLRSMCKECLSISKWAEYSMGWDAPGHIPWENRLDYTTRKWLPEGSLFSSESFSRALFHARNWRTVIGSDFSHWDNMKLGDLNSEMIEMMRELHNLRSYFAETLRDDPDLGFDSSHKPSVPALVVSTSYMTVPLTSLESSSDLSPDFSSAIPSGCGRGTVSPLIIPKDNPRCTTCAILHSDTPTGSLGGHNPDDRAAVITGVENPDEPPLRVEDMISNLRLQCSNMSLTSSLPVDDTSWNSRSPMPLVSDNEAEKPNHSSAVGKQTSAQSAVKPGDEKEPSSSPSSDLRLRGKLNQSKINYKKRTSTDLCSSRPPLTRKSSKRGTANEATSDIDHKVPPSAMAKGPYSRSQKPYKMVRFALPKSEVEEDLVFTPPLVRHSLSTINIAKNPDLKVTPLPDDTPKTIRTNSVSMRKDSSGILSGSLSLRQSKVRTRSVNITPFRKIALARESVDLKALRTESSSTTPVRRSHTLSAHPFSRIIKRPMLALKENKRATIAVDSTAFKIDEKRRISTATLQGNSRKSRIKSLLTRFK